MKKLISLVLVFAVLCTGAVLAACNGEGDQETTTTTKATTTRRGQNVEEISGTQEEVNIPPLADGTKITLDGDLADWQALNLATISCIGVADPDVPNSENKKAIFYGTFTDKGLYLACEAYHDTYVPDSTSDWWTNSNFEFFLGRGNAQKYVYARGIDQDCSTSGTDVIAVMKTTQVDQATKYVTITEAFVAMEELDESEIYYNTIDVGVAWKTVGEDIVGGAGTVRDGADDYWVPVGTWPSNNSKAIVAPSGIYIQDDYQY